MRGLSNQRLFDVLSKLMKLKKRSSAEWNNLEIPHPESIADHCWSTAMLCLIYGQQYGEGVNISRCLELALVHELARVSVPDVPHRNLDGSINHPSPEHAHLEWDAIATMLRGSLLQPVRKLWDEYTAQQSIEAIIVSDLKKIAFALQLMEHMESGGERSQASLRMAMFYMTENLSLPKSREIFHSIANP